MIYALELDFLKLKLLTNEVQYCILDKREQISRLAGKLDSDWPTLYDGLELFLFAEGLKCVIKTPNKLIKYVCFVSCDIVV